MAGAKLARRPPGGHHREGTLRLTAAGPLTGTAQLTLTGLPDPVGLSWPEHEPAHAAAGPP